MLCRGPFGSCCFKVSFWLMQGGLIWCQRADLKELTWTELTRLRSRPETLCHLLTCSQMPRVHETLSNFRTYPFWRHLLFSVISCAQCSVFRISPSVQLTIWNAGILACICCVQDNHLVHCIMYTASAPVKKSFSMRCFCKWTIWPVIYEFTLTLLAFRPRPTS